MVLNISYFHPYLGRRFPFWLMFFNWVVQPPARSGLPLKVHEVWVGVISWPLSGWWKTQASWVDRCDIPSFARKKTQGSLTAGSPNKNPTSKRWQVKRAWSRQLHSPEVPGSLALDSLGDFFFWSENRGVSAGPPTPSGPRTRLFLVCKRDDGSELLKPWNHYSTPWKINMEPTNHPFR